MNRLIITVFNNNNISIKTTCNKSVASNRRRAVVIDGKTMQEIAQSDIMEVVNVYLQPGSSYKIVSRNIKVLIAQGYTVKQAVTKAHALAAKATYRPEPVITIKLPVYKAKSAKVIDLKATVKPTRKVKAKVVSFVAKKKNKPIKAKRRVINAV